jgi:hypothetical protein
VVIGFLYSERFSFRFVQYEWFLRDSAAKSLQANGFWLLLY